MSNLFPLTILFLEFCEGDMVLLYFALPSPTFFLSMFLKTCCFHYNFVLLITNWEKEGNNKS